MKNYAMSVQARLKNKMKLSKEPLSLIQLQYVQERFLFRLSQSEYKQSFILKGGVLFYAWTGLHFRPTKDLDFLFYEKLEAHTVLTAIQGICQLSYPEDGIIFLENSFKVEEIKEQEEYTGLRVTFTAKIASSVIPMQLDICTGDKVTPAPDETIYPTILSESSSTSLRTYPKETVLSEKIHAMIILDLSNSRMKDYFDVYTIIERFKEDLDQDIIKEALIQTFMRRETKLPNDLPRIWQEYFYEEPLKLKQWQAFVKKNKLEQELTLEKVCLTISEYFAPLFQNRFN